VPIESRPTLDVPLIQVVRAVVELTKGIQLEVFVFPVAHGIADDITTGMRQPVKLRQKLGLGPLK